MRTARLSLTMPSPGDANNDPGQSQPIDVSKTPGSPRQGSNQGVTSKDADVGDERGPKTGRLDSPASAPTSRPQEPLSPVSPRSPSFTSLPQFPPSPGASSKHAREQSKSFFANLKASKSSAKIQPAETTIRKVLQDATSSDQATRPLIKTKSTPDLRVTNASEPVPDLPSLESNQSGRDLQPGIQSTQTDVHAQQVEHSLPPSSHKIPRRPVGGQAPILDTTKPNTLVHNSAGPTSPIPETHESRKNGRLFHNFMKRNHSSRGDEGSSSSKPGTPVSSKPPDLANAKPPSRDHSTGRNTTHTEAEESYVLEKHGSKSQLKDQRSQSFRDGAGATLFSGIKHTTAKAAEGLGKAHNRLFKQSKQHNSHNHRTTEYSQFYEPKVINLPLVEQTRITRIAKRLEDSKDKTEFWMPALPWRCIE